jgi:aspartate/methionine/tyrosine aminotransferase
MKPAQRTRLIDPFYVMEVAKAAVPIARRAAQTGDAPMIYLNIGEPDFTAPPPVQDAAVRAIRSGMTQYTPATGLPELRERIRQWYAQRWGVNIATQRIIITAGASAALQLACLALIDEGDEVLMPDPSYPCNRHFVHSAGGLARMLPTDAAHRFQLSAAQVQAAWATQTKGVLLASPSNPTGTSIARQELGEIITCATAQGGFTLIDEIYLGLSYDPAYGQSALSLPGADASVISINSFSKYFNMTGWRLGWMVVPDVMVEVIERLAQNLYICPSAVSQYAALGCFDPSSLALYEQRREEFRQRRDFFVPALNRLGMPVPVMPDGAFYAYADCSEWCRHLDLESSWELSFALMERLHLAVTPGRDFGLAEPGKYLRFSTARSMTELHQAVERLGSLAPPCHEA